MPTSLINWRDGGSAVFIHVPRTAGTSFCHWMGAAISNLGPEHMSAAEVRALEGMAQVEMFGVVRNPYERAVSQFCYDAANDLRGAGWNGHGEVERFERWVLLAGGTYMDNPRWQARALLCDAKTGEEIATPVEFSVFLAAFPELPVRNRSRRVSHMEAFYRHEAVRERVAELGAWEIDRFGFTLDALMEAA